MAKAIARRVRRRTQDAFSNPAARLGFGTPSLNEGALYPLTRMSYNYKLFNSLYRSSWIVQRIIDTIPQDMVKNWYELVTQLEPDQIKQLKQAERRTRIRQSLLHGLQWGFLYGGAGALMMIDGEEGRLEEPLDFSLIMPGAFKGLLVLDRWSGISADTATLVENPSDPEFGLPDYYTINSDTNSAARVHHSRILRFTGCEMPYLEKTAESYWGTSKIEAIFEEIKHRDNAVYNAINLIFMANIRTYKMGNLRNLLAVGNAANQRRIYNTLENMNQIMSNQGIVVLDSDDEFMQHQYAFSGLDTMLMQIKQDVAGAAEIPATKLFGMSPSGLNATGESDLQNYYDSIEQKQEAKLRPVLEQLLPVLMMSELGGIPDDWDIEFNDVHSLTEKEKMETAESKTRMVLDAYNSGLINKPTALKELAQMREENNFWSNITDEVILEAEKEPKIEAPDFDGLALDSLDNAEFEGKHPRREDGKFGKGGGNTKKDLTGERESGTLKSSSKRIGEKGGTLQAQDMPEIHISPGKYGRAASGSTVTKIHSFAGAGTGKPLRVEEHLIQKYGGHKGQWQHTTGDVVIHTDKGDKTGEVHWFQEPSVGIVDARVKRWRD